MKNCLLRSFQALLVFSLAFTLTNCGNLDNPLEELSGGGSGGSGDGGGSSTINATDIKLDQTLKVIKLGGDALTIKVTVTPSDANYTWESDATAIATVDETGKVTPVGVGIATITAKSGDVKATCKIFVGNEVDLSAKTEDYEVKDFDILKGNMGAYSLTIPDGYNVAFAGITTDQTVTCSGDATIYLTDGSTNTVNVSGSAYYNAGIKVGPTDKTLTIEAETDGDGILNAFGGPKAAGIGTGNSQTGGNITINGGIVEARGGADAAGIGTGDTDSGDNACGDITINGGTVTALGGYAAAGIGTGLADGAKNTCGDITIKANVTKVTAKRGDMAPKIIGTGFEDSGATQSCGAITFGTAQVFDGTAATNTWETTIVFNTNGDYGPYGGLNLNISKTTNDHDTWVLTPVAP